MSDGDREHDGKVVHIPSPVGYKSPPVHTRFRPGQSGNPSGRAKGSQNLKTIFNKILNEKIAVREGAKTKKVSKGEAVLRTVVVAALRGDVRHTAMLMKLAEEAGGFEEEAKRGPTIQIVRWMYPGEDSNVG